MRWDLEDGERAQIIARRRERLGKPVTAELLPPSTPEGYEVWLSAFWDLSTDRALGFGGVGPIPSRAIRDWTAGWDEDEAELFRVCIRAMDRVFLAHANGEGETPENSESDNPARDAFRAKMRR